jgi:hypothetical protein
MNRHRLTASIAIAFVILVALYGAAHYWQGGTYASAADFEARAGGGDLVPIGATSIQIYYVADSGGSWGTCSYRPPASNPEWIALTDDEIASLRIEPPPLFFARWFDRRLTEASARRRLAAAGWLFFTTPRHTEAIALDPTQQTCWFFIGDGLAVAFTPHPSPTPTDVPIP